MLWRLLLEIDAMLTFYNANEIGGNAGPHAMDVVAQNCANLPISDEVDLKVYAQTCSS